MANVQIVAGGPSDLATLTHLHNEIFRPPQQESFFQRRFLGRYNLALFFAILEERPVGFVAGFELRPSTYYAWLCGVLNDYRGAGVAGQLVEALEAWAAQHEYRYFRMECSNRHREVLSLAIDMEYDIVGVRWDHEKADQQVVLEKILADTE